MMHRLIVNCLMGGGKMIRAKIVGQLVQCDYLEIPVALGCNLSCDNCSHFSNYKHKGILTIDECDTVTNTWSNKINPTKINILGGEPLINPDLIYIIEKISDKFDGQLMLTTNGLLLPKKHKLLDVLYRKNVILNISIHSTDLQYLAQMRSVKELLKSSNIVVIYNDSITPWYKRYIGYGNDMLPYEDDNKRLSWSNCKGRDCVQLYYNKLWKCAPVAYLQLQKQKFNISDKWDRYLAYAPLTEDCSLQQIVDFYNSEEEDCCYMCPSRPERFVKTI